MTMDFYFYAVLMLALFAVFDLVVGVSNDAVNFLNPAIGSKAASRRFILFAAGLGILAGVTFSSGMMEVARKGIFHPEFFSMPELLAIFSAVMITDIILLDTFSSLGLPTSTTVSVVFELLGSAIAVSILKILRSGESIALLGSYINTGKAMMIIGGIFFAIVVAFISGAIVQFFSRLIFTFDYEKTIKRYGAIWGGAAMASVTFFILIKGAKGASFMTPETIAWINNNTLLILGGIAAVSAVILEFLILMKVNIFKPIVLIGTFAIAMAFAANDLVNFIGVPMAGWNAYTLAAKSADPATASMLALEGKVPANTMLLLLAGIIMVLTILLSKKARTVISTGVDLSQQDEGVENFGASFLSRTIVRAVINISDSCRILIPATVRNAIAKRFEYVESVQEGGNEEHRSFDLLRAAVNIMVASMLISYGTAHKLPLSTTYVTFMVAMGASFADRAWGRESAVYRVTGVLTVVGGWLLTALIALSISSVVATAIFFGKFAAILILLVIVGLVIWKNHASHAKHIEAKEKNRIFNLKKITDISSAAATTYQHIAILLQIIAESLDKSTEALFTENVYALKKEKDMAENVRKWSNIIIANAFKSLRLLQKQGNAQEYNYLQIVRRLQKISDGYADIVVRSYEHVANHHKGLLPSQIEELRSFKAEFLQIMDEANKNINTGISSDISDIKSKKDALKEQVGVLQKQQLERIQSGEAKTRLSILFFGLIGNLYMITSQVYQLLEILQDSFNNVETRMDIYNE